MVSEKALTLRRRMIPVISRAETKTEPCFVMKRFCLPPFLACCLAATALNAQEEKAPFDLSQAKNSELGLPSPMDKLLGLDAALGGKAVAWGGVYRELSHNADLSALKDETSICLALGVRIADGIMAVKAKDANALNECPDGQDRARSFSSGRGRSTSRLSSSTSRPPITALVSRSWRRAALRANARPRSSRPASPGPRTRSLAASQSRKIPPRRTLIG